MRSHTLGPWNLGNYRAAGKIYNPNIIADADGNGICEVYGIPLHVELVELLRSANEGDREGLANARLIAAAPDLLEALEAVYRALKPIKMAAHYSRGHHNQWENCGFEDCQAERAMLQQAEAAICKAEGEKL